MIFHVSLFLQIIAIRKKGKEESVGQKRKGSEKNKAWRLTRKREEVSDPKAGVNLLDVIHSFISLSTFSL